MAWTRRIAVDAGGGIGDQRLILPAIPELQDDIDELCRHGVAIVVLGQIGQASWARRARRRW